MVPLLIMQSALGALKILEKASRRLYLASLLRKKSREAKEQGIALLPVFIVSPNGPPVQIAITSKQLADLLAERSIQEGQELASLLIQTQHAYDIGRRIVGQA